MKYLVLCLLLFSLAIASGQSIVEQKKKFLLTSNAQQKAEIASDLAWSLKDINPDSSLFFAKEALRFSRKARDHKIEAYSLSDIGNYFKRKENYQTAKLYYEQSLDVRIKSGEKEDIISAYNQMGLLYRQWEKYDSAAYYFSKGLKIIPPKQFLDLRMKILDGLGMTQFHQGDFQNALRNIDASRILSEQLKDSLAIAQSWQNTGTINQYLGYSSLAIKNYKKAEFFFKSIGNVNGEIEMRINCASIFLIQGRYKESEEMLLAMDRKSTDLGFNDSRSTIYLNLAHLYDKLGKDAALKYFLKAYEYGKQLEKVNTVIEGALGMVNYYVNNKRPEDANAVILELDSLIFEENREGYFPEYFDMKAALARLENNFEKAFMYSQKAILFRDKLFKESGQARELLTTLKITEEEKKALAEKLKRKDAESKTGKLVMLVLALLIILLVIVIFFVSRNLRMKREQKVSELNFESEISDIIYRSELKFLEGGLELRKRIGRDLHDNLGSKLAVAQMRIDSLNSNQATSNTNELKEISELIESSCVDLRSISHDLVNEGNAQGALGQAIEVLCFSIPQSENFVLQFNAIGEPFSISLIVKRNLIATISLLLDNALKHSKASLVNLQIFYHEDALNIEMEDNGIGFDIKKKVSGIGLKNAFSRIEIIHGTIEVNSHKNKGTSISISVPIKTLKNE